MAVTFLHSADYQTVDFVAAQYRHHQDHDPNPVSYQVQDYLTVDAVPLSSALPEAYPPSRKSFPYCPLQLPGTYKPNALVRYVESSFAVEFPEDYGKHQSNTTDDDELHASDDGQ